MTEKKETANITPLFTIVTVTWNAGKVILPTLESVAHQSFTDFEYLVIDGASTDDTLSLVGKMEIENTRIISEKDNGLYDAMNKAITLGRGKFIIWLNAGDAFADSGALARLERTLQQNRQADVLYGQTVLVDSRRRVVGKRHLTAPKCLTAKSFRRGMVVCHQAFVAKRKIVPKYDLRYRFSADYDWCIKVLKKSRCNAYVGDMPLIHYLCDEGVTVKHHRASLVERFNIMCRHYGTGNAITAHLSFVPRAVARRFKKKSGK